MEALRGPAQVLVVDDDEGERLLASVALTQAGFAVVEAANGEQALAACQRRLPDMVLLDVIMPGLDGFAVCERLRQQPGAAHLPILMVTGLDDLDSIERAYRSGATDFITKPIQWLILHQRVRYILRASQAFQALGQAKRHAEQASQAKSDFLSMMSHELRSPMTGVLGALSLLLQTPLPEESMRYARIAHDSAQSLLAILNDILDVAKLEAGKIAIEHLDFAVEPLIDEVIQLMSALAAGKGLRLTVERALAVPRYLRGDPVRLRQILLNLVSNAIKFTEVGGVTVSLAYEPSATLLKITVTDSGIGIAPPVQQRLFARFTQADSSISRNYGGTGLGLAICKQLCELMGGEIGVRSSPGQGSAFWFTVRCEPGEPLSSDRAAPAAPTLSRKLHILLAEDSPINQIIIQAILGKAGHTLEIVNHGRAAVEAAARTGFDLILMDVQMPELNGVSATQAIRALAAPYSSAPIIALTASALREQQADYLAAGMNDYVSKPFTEETLLSAIARQCAAHPPLDRADGAGTADAPFAEWSHLSLFDAGQLDGVRRSVGAAALGALLEQGLAAVKAHDARINSAWQAGDIDQIHKIAHRLKGEAGTLGLQRIAAIAAFLDKTTEPAGFAPAIRALDQACQETAAAMANQNWQRDQEGCEQFE